MTRHTCDLTGKLKFTGGPPGRSPSRAPVNPRRQTQRRQTRRVPAAPPAILAHRVSDRVPKLLFLLSCAFFAFLYGFCAATFRWPPHRWLEDAFRQLGALPQPIDPQQHRFPARHPFSGVRSVGARGDDLILLSSFWSDRGGAPGVRVIDRKGTVRHEWILDVPKLFAGVRYEDVGPRYVHGAHLFENGDLLCNVEYLGLLRLDPRGQVVWRLDRRTHHSVTRTERGDFWVCGARWIEPDEAALRFPGLEAPLWDEQALLVSERGEVQREVSVLQAVFDSPYRALLWSTQYAPRPLPRHDLMHLNDVEELPSALAASYPLFAAGDLLVSMRFLNLVAVLDGEGKRVKWAAGGQFLEQHDPDFLGDGKISVYDNRTDWTVDGSRCGGSRLVAVTPHTGASEPIYPRAGVVPERGFYSLHGGKAQALADGGWLVTEPSAGRVFEINAAGKVVWEWVQQSDGDLVAEVLEGTRYAPTPQMVSAWAATTATTEPPKTGR